MTQNKPRRTLKKIIKVLEVIKDKVPKKDLEELLVNCHMLIGDLEEVTNDAKEILKEL